MKTFPLKPNRNGKIARPWRKRTSALCALGMMAALLPPGEVRAEASENASSSIEETPTPPSTMALQNASPSLNASPRLERKKSSWGWEVGGVFNEFPVSKAIDSGFAILMSHGYYSWYLGDGGNFVQPSLSLGAYGFQLLLPVPEISLGATLGSPGQDLRGKVSVGGFYDMFVGGHAGLTVSGGLLIKDRFTVNLFMVPFGKDADRDYLYMAGTRDKEVPCTKDDPCVEMPYFGIFVGMQY